MLIKKEARTTRHDGLAELAPIRFPEQQIVPRLDIVGSITLRAAPRGRLASATEGRAARSHYIITEFGPPAAASGRRRRNPGRRARSNQHGKAGRYRKEHLGCVVGEREKGWLPGSCAILEGGNNREARRHGTGWFPSRGTKSPAVDR